MSDYLITADARRVSGADFYRAIMGLPPMTEAEKREREAARQAWLEQRRIETRREIEELRDRLCALASPKLQAEWRAKWAAEDAADEQRQRRAA